MRFSRVTIADVAQEANVSKQTVSRVLNDKEDVSAETRQRVQAVIERLGYRPNTLARNLAFSRSLLIGLVFPNVDIPLFVDMIRGVEHVADQNDYHILLKEGGVNGKQEQHVLTALDDFRVNGIIMVGPLMPDDELVRHLQNFDAGALINFTNTALLPEQISTINVDSYQTMSELVETLIHSGRRHFAYLNGPVSFPAAERRQAVIDTLARYDLNIPDSHILQGRYTPEFGYHAALQLMTEQPELDAILTFDDDMAVGVLKACSERGVCVPDDIAVTGWQDIPIASYTTPTLTTVRVPRFKMGVTAAQIVFDRLNNKPVEQVVSIKPQIIYRESTPKPDFQ